MPGYSTQGKFTTCINFSTVNFSAKICQHCAMSLSTQEADDDGQYALLAIIDNAKNVSNILKAIHFKEVISY